MYCLEDRLSYEVDLDFGQLVIENWKRSIKLIIQNKFIYQIKKLTPDSNYSQMVVSLRIENCKMKEIKANSFEKMVSLNELFLINDNLEIIQRDSFKGLEMNLKLLEIVSNRLKVIKENEFFNLKNLENFMINSNEIEQIDTNAFYGIANIKQLKINSNILKSIQNNLFDNLTVLEELWLQENEIDNIEINSFDSLKNLIKLYLHSNKNRFKMVYLDI